MNNDLKISMKLVSSDNISMKLEDSKPIDVNMNGGIVEIDPVFTDSPAYTITYNDITNWNNKSDFSGNYNDLKNKPTIPEYISQLVNDVGFIDKNVNNLANYTLSTNISEVGLTGNYNDLLNTPTLPTKTSDLTNDSGFITNTVNNLTNYTLTSNLASVATSGSYNDLSNTPSLATVATTGFYSDLINKPTIPSQTSQLTNDSGFITSANIPTKTSDLTNDSGFITMSDIPTIPTKTSELTNDSGYITNANIPTKTSDLTNDSGFITNTVNDLTNYTLTSNLSSVATSGNYNDLSNKPTIPTMETLNIYSTTETVIGIFLNKPLYRKVINVGNKPTDANINISNVVSDLDTLVKISGTAYNSGFNQYYNIPNAHDTMASWYINAIIVSKKDLQIRGGNGWNSAGGLSNIYVVIEYTKTTD